MKRIIITGAGSGMGRSTAIRLSREADSELILLGRREAPLVETMTMLNGEGHRYVAMDVRNSDSWKELFSSIPAAPLHALFANAGIGGENHYGKADRWEEIISINLTGTYISIQECLPHMKLNDGAFRHILITSSCLARFGVPNYTAYCTAKTGLLGLTRSLAVELASSKILVNALCPGWVHTEMAVTGIAKLAERSGQPYTDTFREQMSLVPLNRISEPEEIGEMVSFLFSGRQVSITGQAIDINNGSFMI